MSNVPRNCITCPYESSCNTAMYMSDCYFYNQRQERTHLAMRLKDLFGKVFK